MVGEGLRSQCGGVWSIGLARCRNLEPGSAGEWTLLLYRTPGSVKTAFSAAHFLQEVDEAEGPEGERAFQCGLP